MDPFSKARYLLSRVKRAYSDRGLAYLLSACAKTVVTWPLNMLVYGYLRSRKPSATFTYQGDTYTYFHHPFNVTWANERAVEVPIIWELLKDSGKCRILEVGNVLSHYFPIAHDVLDKYDEAENVINQDVATFAPPEKFDLIVSISTLEHIGWDEHPRDSTKMMRAIRHLHSLLLPGGRMVVTFPLGYNPELDRLLGNGELPFTELRFLKRISHSRWQETSWEEIRHSSYNFRALFPSANGVVIGFAVNEHDTDSSTDQTRSATLCHK